MVVDDLTPQAVGHQSGAIVASIDRFALIYALNGRSLRLPIEPIGTYYVRLPDNPRWSDNSAITAAEAAQIRTDVADTLAHWGLGCDFVLPGDARVLSTIDQLVGYIRSQAVSA